MGGYHASGAELRCQGEVGKEILINRFGTLPKEAKGEIQYCKQERGEFRADEVVRLNLEPSDYRVRFFVKNLEKEPRYQIALLRDGLRFTVLAWEGQMVEILSPRTDSQVEITVLVKGKVSDPKLHVYLFVHPLLTNLWWVQPIPSPPNKDGSWASIAYFGEAEKGVGEYFEILAIAAPERALFREWEQLRTEKVTQIMEQYTHSDLSLVKRVR